MKFKSCIRNLSILFVLFVVWSVGCGHKEAYFKDVAYDLTSLIRLQEEVDMGHRVGHLDPKATAMRFLEEGLKDPGPFDRVVVGGEKKGRVRVLVRSKKSAYELELFRPIRPDSSGIFVVSGYRVLSLEEVDKRLPPKEESKDPSETS